MSSSRWTQWPVDVGIPDGEHTSGLGETGLFLNTADALLENGGDLGGGGFGIDSIASDLLGGGVEESGRGSGLLRKKSVSARLSGRGALSQPSSHSPSPRRSSIAEPLAPETGNWSCRRRSDGVQAQLQLASMDLPMQVCPWQRLQQPGCSRCGGLLRT
jgi:hypothetical protein